MFIKLFFFFWKGKLQQWVRSDFYWLIHPPPPHFVIIIIQHVLLSHLFIFCEDPYNVPVDYFSRLGMELLIYFSCKFLIQEIKLGSSNNTAEMLCYERTFPRQTFSDILRNFHSLADESIQLHLLLNCREMIKISRMQFAVITYFIDATATHAS